MGSLGPANEAWIARSAGSHLRITRRQSLPTLRLDHPQRRVQRGRPGLNVTDVVVAVHQV